MNGADLIMLVAIIASLFAMVFLAIAETSINRISKVKAQALADARDTKSAHALFRLVSDPPRFINPVLVSATVCQMGQAFLTTLLANSLFGATGVVVGFAVNVVIFFVIAEAMPKTWAVVSAERAALTVARPTDWLVSFPPLRIVSSALIGLANAMMPGKGLKQGPFVSELELLGIVGAAAEDEVIEAEERDLIESIIEFGDTVAREVMVPRPDMLTVDSDATVSTALDLAITNGVSRLPVYGADDDDIVGLAYIKDLIGAERGGRGRTAVLDVARAVRFVPENKPVRQLMREMQAGQFHLAIVADEYGGVAGLVTLEDCLEELVGEIVDEYDVEEIEIEQQPNGDYLVAGGTPVGDLSERLGCQLPDDDWDSVGGLVFSTLGHVPEIGESVVQSGWRFNVVELDGRRIRSVRVSAAPQEAHAGGEEHDRGHVVGAAGRNGEVGPTAGGDPSAGSVGGGGGTVPSPHADLPRR